MDFFTPTFTKTVFKAFRSHADDDSVQATIAGFGTLCINALSFVWMVAWLSRRRVLAHACCYELGVCIRMCVCVLFMFGYVWGGIVVDRARLRHRPDMVRNYVGFWVTSSKSMRPVRNQFGKYVPAGGPMGAPVRTVRKKSTSTETHVSYYHQYGNPRVSY